MLVDLLLVYLILIYLECKFDGSINTAAIIFTHEKNLLIAAVAILQFLEVIKLNWSRYKIERLTCYFLRYVCFHTNYYLQIIFFATKKAKIVKDVLDKKVFTAGIAATAIVAKLYSPLYLPFLGLIAYLLLADLLLVHLQSLSLHYNFYK